MTKLIENQSHITSGGEKKNVILEKNQQVGLEADQTLLKSELVNWKIVLKISQDVVQRYKETENIKRH